jgi:ribonuclease R
MALQDKVYEHLHAQKLFGKTVDEAVDKTFHAVNAEQFTKQKIKEGLINLIASGTVIIKNGLVQDNQTLMQGVFKQNDKGSGVVVSYKNGVPQEYFVPKPFTKNADTNNTVNFILEKNVDNKPIARITQVVAKSKKVVLGMVEEQNGKYVFIPETKEFKQGVELVQNENARLAVGKRCFATVVNVRKSKQSKEPVKLEIKYQKEIFGEVKNPMSGVYAKLEQYGVTPDFSPEIEKYVATLKPISEEEIANRKDLTKKPFVTIDPPTCKDMDDAVLVEPIIKNGVQTGYKLYVAIADVAHYVKPGSVLDKEAYQRGNSIYPAGLVVPMLPKGLSNNLCSLNPHEDKAVMVTEIDISNTGEILAYDIYDAVINSKHKFAYEEVSALHHNEKEALKKFGEYKKAVTMLYDLRNILAKKAEKEGCITMEGYDPTIVLNETKDRVIDFRNDNHVDSHDVIAQAMIMNNRVVAKFLNDLEIPNVLRNHREPSDKSLERLVNALEAMGVGIKIGYDTSVEELYKYITKVAKNHPLEKEIFGLMVRSMRKAEYHTNKETGHFALGLKDYTHFTSPIRRYPDLIEHRLAKEAIKTIKAHAIKEKQDSNKSLSELVKTVSETTKKKLKEISNEAELYLKAYHLSTTERTANQISMETSEICMALYMEQFVGQVKKGKISKIDKDGVVVTLADKDDPEHSDIIEVKVSLKDLKRMSGGYEANEHNTSLKTKKKSNVRYDLGSKVEIKILEANPITREIRGSLDLTKEHKNKQEVSLEQ